MSAKTKKELMNKAFSTRPPIKERSVEEGPPRSTQSLVHLKADLVKKGEFDDAVERERYFSVGDNKSLIVDRKEDEKMMEDSNFRPLQTVTDLAKGVEYTKSLYSSWKPPSYISKRSESENESIRKKFHIIADGEDMPPPIRSFEEMKIPKEIIDALHDMDITQPSSIQIQGLPVVLSKRDVIGIAYTGSGKTMVFSIPMVIFSIEDELLMPVQSGEGPFGLVLCPSRELARQTFEIVERFSQKIEAKRRIRLRTVLMIGGLSLRDQERELRGGVHMIIATPGRLLEALKKRIIHLTSCNYFVMDEADRLIDSGFEEEIRDIVNFFKGQRQTILFSATMPTKIQQFAKSALVRPITVNVGRAGAASLDVIQEIEYVRQEAKIVYLLDCLQKTPPPIHLTHKVLIFCENKNDVDDIYEYLLLKGVDAVCIHGAKEQEDREHAIRSFREGKKDVLVATDVASKGLDFHKIQHVINYDMPKEIENYVHRIGRTGRSGKTGIATTFVNQKDGESILTDLKELLIESKQRIPPFLQSLETPENRDNRDACAYCGGLGHRMRECTKNRVKTSQGGDSGKGDW
ncbi:putative ATP-dependent RNA helicase DDX41 [Planoprotostelium fungivorum]|uniref:RNA helicase n=1 Tax=Planoprotostelium fungivorum TaxID=1890364 RepID=A0A2P6MYD5_9EUKA|nr:putative ATP-dependent RNA helicase DDX41 [Planoprotostelium fungivorum]